MVNKRVLAAKCSAIEHHLARVIVKRQIDLQVFLKDLDRRESILFNLQMAVQNCIDMAAHVVSDEERAHSLFFEIASYNSADLRAKKCYTGQNRSFGQHGKPLESFAICCRHGVTPTAPEFSQGCFSPDQSFSDAGSGIAKRV